MVRTGLIHNPENYTTLNHSKSINDTFRDKEKERFLDDKKDGLTEIHALKYIKDSLNPIKQQIMTKCITFDTRFRENYYDIKVLILNVIYQIVLQMLFPCN